MTVRHHIVGVLLALTGLVAGCTTDSSAPSSAGPTVSKNAPPTGLCTFIQSKTAAELTAAGDGPILFAPLQPAGGQIANCEFAPENLSAQDLNDSIAEISVAPATQHGVDVFANLQARSSISSSKINGNQIAWSPSTSILYMRFTDKNPVYADSADGTDSILTVNDEAGLAAPNTVGLSATPPTFLVNFAQHIADEVASGRVYSTSTCPLCRNWGSGPMLIDDSGQEVSNPIIVLDVYELLVSGEMYGLGGVRSTISSVPYLIGPSAQPAIARSMTVHPHCDAGCTYPDFASIGWRNATARADGIKLGIDPAKVPDPTIGHSLSVFTSNFPPCMCVWGGTSAPSSS